MFRLWRDDSAATVDSNPQPCHLLLYLILSQAKSFTCVKDLACETLHKSTVEHRPPPRNTTKQGPEPPASIDFLHFLPGCHSIYWGDARHFACRYEAATRKPFFPIGCRFFVLYGRSFVISPY
ncbi:unnamed protein product [Parnassius mnemosyne]|uniref:Uncharacterized protein n=1 Tax=Parnassius mnemosyne TaxID=213953 RepID=A0AAV1LL05_9NEOP